MPLDIYSTRAQLAMIESQPREYSFLYDTFVKELAPVEDDRAIYDYRKGSRPMAPFVTEGTGGVLMGRDGYRTMEIGFPTIAPRRVISSSDLKTRAFGERILGGMTPEQRGKKMLVQDQIDMRRAIQRRREWMTRQVLLNGKLDIFNYTSEGRNKQTTLVADYGFTNKYVPTAWDQTGAKIEYDMKKMFDMVYEGGGYVDIILMDPKAADAMMENAKYIKQFDGRNIDMGAINTKYKGAGIRFIGWNSDGVELYSMSGTFVDDDGTTKNVLPDGTVIAGSREMLKCLHGPVMQVEGYGESAKHVWYVKKEVPQRLGSPDSNTISNQITSRPTIIPFNVDAWCVGTVL